jgi:outer membrane lipoprotein-sorting protein
VFKNDRFFYFASAAFLLGVVFAKPNSAFASNSPEKVLQIVDDIRNPGESFLLKIEVKSTEDVDEPWKGDVLIKGKAKTLIRTTSPARLKGQNYLMLDQDMWAYVPNLKRAVRATLSQKLTGEAANGDIARTRWSGDYSVKFGPPKADQLRLDLKAARKGLTYEGIRVWVRKDDFRPERAEYLSVSGKVLKTAVFSGYKNLVGRLRPTNIAITNQQDPSKNSVIKVLEMREQEMPDSLFTKQSLQ